MKKLFLLLAVVGILATACEGGGYDNLNDPIIEIVGGKEALSLNFPSSGVSPKSITFSSNCDWSVTTSESWIKVTPDRGEAGEECQITISLDENTTYDTRSGKITISIESLAIDVEVTQSQNNALIVTNSEVTLPQAGGSFEVVVKSNIEYEYEIKADWIKSVESRALVENSLRFEAEANPTTDVRTGEIVFSGEGITESVIVTQSQTNVITLSSSTFELDTNGGSFSVDVSSNVEYNVAIEESCDWISQTKTRAVTTSTLNFVVSENSSGADRTATITISGEELSETIIVNQKHKEPAPQSNEIWYTSTDGNVVMPYRTDVFGANIVSNTYENGKGVITFDGDVTSIGKMAFFASSKTYDGRRLTSITIPDGVTVIGAAAFNGCKSLTSITIPDSVTSIVSRAFSYCESLTSFYGKFASADNRCLVVNKRLVAFAPAGLVEYTIPNTVTVIEEYTFNDCTSLIDVTIGNSVTRISSFAFYGCTSLTSVTIPDSLNAMGGGVFAGCESLTSFYGKFASADNRCLVIGKKIIAFAPAGLAEYTIPSTVTGITEYAFYDCTLLTSVTIPDSVTSIGREAFCYCESLTSVYCMPTTPPIGNYYMFDSNASEQKIYVPTASVEAYKSAEYWSNYKSYIEGYNF